MAIPRPASPRVLFADLRAFARQRSKHQWIALVAAVGMPAILIYGFYRDSQTNMKLPEQIIYAESWSGTRTDEEIKAAQKERQARREALKAERQRQYQELERRLGMK
jgi:hypothetical protein